MLKICTDTYKIIDKNIPLLTIHLGGKPCERLEGAGWLAGGVRGWVGDREEAWAVVLLGLGLLLGLFWGCLHLRNGGNRTGSDLRHKHPTFCSKPAAWGGPRLVGLGLAVLRVVLLVCLCLGVFLCLLGLLVLLLIVHSLFFLRGGGEQCCHLLCGE